MGTHFAKTVSENELTVKDFQHETLNWYRNFSIQLQSSKTLIIQYDAHLRNGEVHHVKDVLQKK
jgi:hypothetical protein